MDIDGVANMGSNRTEEYAAKLCDDYVYGGYDDWFLPSIEELEAMEILFRAYIIFSSVSTLMLFGPFLLSASTCLYKALVHSTWAVNISQFPKAFCSFAVKSSIRRYPNATAERVNNFGGIFGKDIVSSL